MLVARKRIAPHVRVMALTSRFINELTGAEFVHPYNDWRVIAGQATCSAELVEQVRWLDAVVAPIGGGGMVSEPA